MVMSGATKLQASCPSWDKLTALEYHFATQPLPTAAAWYFHQLPPQLLRLGVASTLLIELPATLLLVSPRLCVRLWGAVLQGLLQVVILVTGNYNFFNLLTLVLLIAVCEKEDIDHRKRKESNSLRMLIVSGAMVYAFLAVSCWLMFEVRYIAENGNESCSNDNFGSDNCGRGWEGWDWNWDRVLIQVRSDFDLQAFITPGVLTGYALTLGGLIISSLRCCITAPKTQLMYFPILLLYISFSLVSFSSIGVNLEAAFPPSLTPPNYYNQLRTFSSHKTIQMMHISNSYGLFRRMTGMGEVTSWGEKGVGGMPPSIVARPEVFLEGQNEEDRQWYPIYFHHKPGNFTKAPSYVVPHQPRLDWQMWFATLGSYSHNPWLVNFLTKLLSGDSPEVLALIYRNHFYRSFSTRRKRESSEEEVDIPTPAAIRARLGHLDFTRYHSTWAHEIHPGNIDSDESLDSRRSNAFVNFGESDAAWWHWLDGGSKEPYLPLTLEKDSPHPSVEQFLQAHGWGSEERGPYVSAAHLRQQCSDGAFNTMQSSAVMTALAM